jgi:hypothetical protein
MQMLLPLPLGEGWGGGDAQWNARFSIFLWRFWVSEELQKALPGRRELLNSKCPPGAKVSRGTI